MTGKTHKRVSLFLAYLGCGLFYWFYGRDYFEHIWEYYILCAVCAEFCKEGTLFPDLDHNWNSVKEKTALAKVINLIIHLTGGKHRSRHTHSWDICIVLGGGMIYGGYLLSKTNAFGLLLFVSCIGFVGGWATHLLADMLTKDGAYLFCWMKKRTAFVPSHFLGIDFKTGDSWEDFVCKVATFFEWVFFLAAMFLPLGIYLFTHFSF